MLTYLFAIQSKGKNKECILLNSKNKKGPLAALSQSSEMEACLGFDLTNLLPPSGLSGIQNGFANVLSFQGIPEVGSEGPLLSGTISLDKIGELVDEAMLVTDVQSGHPPLVHVGVFSSVVGNMDGSPATGLGVFLVVLEIFETVQVMQVPEEGTIGTVDLEGIKRLVTSGITG